jgi:hypothetical protein
MALAITTKFISDLVANDKQNFTTEAEAAAAFARAFVSYFDSVTVPVLIAVPSMMPAATTALVGGLILAFKCKDPATVSAALHQAIGITYISTFAPTFFAGATIAVAATPLPATLIPAMSVLSAESVTAKTALATTIATWLQTVTITVGSAAVALV